MDYQQYVRDVKSPLSGKYSLEDCVKLSNTLSTADLPPQCASILERAQAAGIRASPWNVAEGHGVKSYGFKRDGFDAPTSGGSLDEEYLRNKPDEMKEKIRNLRTKMSLRGALNVPGVDEAAVAAEREKEMSKRKSRRKSRKADAVNY